jgi:hypothetical protein
MSMIHGSEVFQVDPAHRETMEEMCNSLFGMTGRFAFIADVLWFADCDDAMHFKMVWFYPEDLKCVRRVS